MSPSGRNGLKSDILASAIASISATAQIAFTSDAMHENRDGQKYRERDE